MRTLTNQNVTYESYLSAVKHLLEIRYGTSVADQAMNNANDRDDLRECYEAGDTVGSTTEYIYNDFNEQHYYSGKPL